MCFPKIFSCIDIVHRHATFSGHIIFSCRVPSPIPCQLFPGYCCYKAAVKSSYRSVFCPPPSPWWFVCLACIPQSGAKACSSCCVFTDCPVSWSGLGRIVFWEKGQFGPQILALPLLLCFFFCDLGKFRL